MMHMSTTEINPAEIDKGTLLAVTVAAVAVVGIALVAARKAPKDKKAGSHDPSLSERLSEGKPADGRRARRRHDGHATPMDGAGRVPTAPAFYTYK
ncbi:hypothetical protein [Cutibacterium sp. V947]|uniref:hypothetical protein n=1 Tax=unclassified Cutibacterium TaxID=2649671 RepID=UPI003EE2C24A